MSSSNIAQRLSSRFIALCDHYVHADWRQDEGMLFRARFLVGILIAYQLIVAVALAWVLLLSPMPVIGRVVSTVIMGGTAGSFYWLMRSLPRTGRLRLVAEFTIAITFFAIQTGIVMTGGPLLSPTRSAIVVPPVAAICLIGWRYGLGWGTSLLVVQMLLIVAGTLGLEFPNLTPPDQIEVNRIFAWAIAYTALIGIVLVYETINSQLQRDRDQQHQRHDYLASHDLLTGLANRKQLIDKLNAMLTRLQRKTDVAAVVYLDLDGFKRINDTLGHEGGDKVLQIVAQRLQSAARKHDLLARIGGDEFAILMDDIDTAANAEQAVLRFQQVISATMTEFPQFPISGSFGIAMAPVVSCDAMTLIQVADQAMYLAKKQRQIVVTVNAPVAANTVEAHSTQAGVVTLHAIAADELKEKVPLPDGLPAKNPGVYGWIENKFLERCNLMLAPHLRADPDQLIRGRTLIGVARFIQLAMAFIMITLCVTATSAIDYIVVLAIAIFSAVFTVLLAYLRWSGKLARCIDLMLLIAFIAVQFSTLINGGLAKTPAIDIVVLPVLMAFCLSGRRLGLVWAGLTIAFHICVAVLIEHGVDFAMVHKQQLVHETIAAWGIAYVAILCIIYLFESVNIRLRQERDREFRELEFLATHDALTGLSNRRKFHDTLTQALDRMRNRPQAGGESLAVIYLDLDGFKPVNDTLGHAVGDVVLQTVARRIGNNVRDVDTVARLGGDEFGIILEGMDTLERVAQIAANIRQDIARPIGGLETYAVSGSIGIAMAPQHSVDGDTLVRMADQAMFRAKAIKDAVAVYQ